MPAARTALLAGATGLVGNHLLDLLLEAPTYRQVTALVRRPLDREHPRLSAPVIDFDRLGDEGDGGLPDGMAVDDIYCCLGTTMKKAGSRDAFRRVDHEYVVQLARLARRAGARRLSLVSSIGADPETRNFYLRVKGETEEAVKALDFPAVDIYRPGLLLGSRQEFRFGERLGIVAMRAVDPLLAGPLRPYRGIPGATVAAGMLAAALRDADGCHVHTNDEIAALADGLRASWDTVTDTGS